jgi:hypothetical protein
VTIGDNGRVRLKELEERDGREPRVLGEYEVPLQDYRRQVAKAGHRFLSFIEGRDYKPIYSGTVATVRNLLGQIDSKA